MTQNTLKNIRAMIEDRYKYTSAEVAYLIVAKANETHYGINLTKAMKLLYILYGTYIAVKKERLTNEYPQAWPYGPVFPIARLALKNVNIEEIRMSDSRVEEIAKDKEIIRFTNFILNTFGKYYPGQLVQWSCKNGGAWDRATKDDDFQWGDCIPDMYIMEYFDGIITRK